MNVIVSQMQAKIKWRAHCPPGAPGFDRQAEAPLQADAQSSNLLSPARSLLLPAGCPGLYNFIPHSIRNQDIVETKTDALVPAMSSSLCPLRDSRLGLGYASTQPAWLNPAERAEEMRKPGPRRHISVTKSFGYATHTPGWDHREYRPSGCRGKAAGTDRASSAKDDRPVR